MRILFFFLSGFIPKLIFAQWIIESAPSDNFSAVNFTSATNGLIAGQHGLYYTNNGGSNWITVNAPAISADSLVFRHTSFDKIAYDSFYWVISGKDTVADKAVIFRMGYISTTCTLVYTGAVGSSLNDISIYGGTAFAVGDNNLIVNSTNAGQNWTNYITPVPVENYRSVAINGSHVTLLGAPGHIYYKTTSSGAWTTYSVSSSVAIVRYNAGSLFGLSDTIFKTVGIPTGWISNHNFCGGVMNASDLSGPLSGPRFISTDHGIYVSNGVNWELQGSSSGFILEGISVPTATIGYAVGNNGLLLKTTNGGVLNIPYPNFSFPSVCCENALVMFANNTSSTYLFSWKVNNILFSNSFSPSYTFPSAGTYSVTMIASNGPYTDSLTQIINVNGLPDLNKTVSVIDSVICRTGSSVITVNNSDTGVVYYLYKVFNSSPIDSVMGNGGGASLNTGGITTTSSYVIMAKYLNVNCDGFFPDTIRIRVVHTHADFRMSLFNALPGESVDYYQYCQDADHYRWYFGSNAIPSFDSTANPSGIVYQNISPNNVHLAVWDDIGCYDSVTIAGAYCFNDTTVSLNTPNCWAFKYVGYNGAGLNNAIALKRNSEMLLGGVFYGGPYIYTTRTGRNWLHTEVSNGGIYLADYTQKGVLRWTIFSHPDVYAGDGENLAGIKILPNGDIVTCGKNESGWFHFNNLDSVYFQGGYFVLCIDSLGKYKWMDRLTIPNIANKYPNMSIDADTLGNIYISGSCYPIQFVSSYYGNQAIPSAPNSSSPFIARIASDGQLAWMTYISQNTVSSNEQYFRIVSIAVSPVGQLYFTGTTLNMTLTLHSTSGQDITVSPSIGQGLMLGCYDFSGMLRWVHCINAMSYINENLDIHDIGNPGIGLEADAHGNVYLAGYMSANPIVFASVNLSPYSYSTSDFYSICSYDRNGDFRWVTGANTTLGSLSGGIYSITLDRLEHLHTATFVNAVTTSSNVIQFLSANGTYTPINMNEPSVYLLDYDTMGVLYHASTEMGLNSTNASQRIEMCLAVNDSGIVFAPGDVWVQSSLTNTNIANSTMSFFTLGSFIAKFSPPCAPTNVFYPQTTSTVTLNSDNQNTFTVSVFPNPFDESTEILLPQSISGKPNEIIFTDMQGRIVRQENVSGTDLFTFKRGNLDAGIYFCTVRSEGETIDVIKIIAE